MGVGDGGREEIRDVRDVEGDPGREEIQDASTAVSEEGDNRESADGGGGTGMGDKVVSVTGSTDSEVTDRKSTRRTPVTG